MYVITLDVFLLLRGPYVRLVYLLNILSSLNKNIIIIIVIIIIDDHAAHLW